MSYFHYNCFISLNAGIDYRRHNLEVPALNGLTACLYVVFALKLAYLRTTLKYVSKLDCKLLQ